MLIEKDDFPFEFISVLAEKESWRKEVYRPIYHVHKWWAKRLGSVFRGLLLGAVLPDKASLEKEFYKIHNYSDIKVFDPFMGSGTTVGEAHKLGFTSLGRDINPVAAEAVRVALGSLDEMKLLNAYKELEEKIQPRIEQFYTTKDLYGEDGRVLYFFWVMQGDCNICENTIDLFSNYIISQNAYPKKKPEIQVLCPCCGEVFPADYNDKQVTCGQCNHHFDPRIGTVNRSTVDCDKCGNGLKVSSLFKDKKDRPNFRLYAKLILSSKGEKQYLKATPEDFSRFEDARKELAELKTQNRILLPGLQLEEGYNTQQSIKYGFNSWKDFFNDRQLLVLGLLHNAILELKDVTSRDALLTLFSSTLEFNNLFASYKGEGTGAVRHMFAHHILKPERVPIETNIWGTEKSSGSFSGLFKTKLLRAIKYRKEPSEVKYDGQEVSNISSRPIIGNLAPWPIDGCFSDGAVHLSCGDSSSTSLPDKSINLVMTDPPFFDNVHYSELADFFYAWQVLHPRGFIKDGVSTRQDNEVQDGNVLNFTNKLNAVFGECDRILKDNGMLIFSYHHSREEGWSSVAKAIDLAGFRVVNAHPVKAEMSGGKPKNQAKSPIQLDVIIICRKKENFDSPFDSLELAEERANSKIGRLVEVGLTLSVNDERVIRFGQYLCTDYFLKERA